MISFTESGTLIFEDNLCLIDSIEPPVAKVGPTSELYYTDPVYTFVPINGVFSLSALEWPPFDADSDVPKELVIEVHGREWVLNAFRTNVSDTLSLLDAKADRKLRVHSKIGDSTAYISGEDNVLEFKDFKRYRFNVPGASGNNVPVEEKVTINLGMGLHAQYTTNVNPEDARHLISTRITKDFISDSRDVAYGIAEGAYGWGLAGSNLFAQTVVDGYDIGFDYKDMSQGMKRRFDSVPGLNFSASNCLDKIAIPYSTLGACFFSDRGLTFWGEGIATRFPDLLDASPTPIPGFAGHLDYTDPSQNYIWSTLMDMEGFNHNLYGNTLEKYLIHTLFNILKSMEYLYIEIPVDRRVTGLNIYPVVGNEYFAPNNPQYYPSLVGPIDDFVSWSLSDFPNEEYRDAVRNNFTGFSSVITGPRYNLDSYDTLSASMIVKDTNRDWVQPNDGIFDARDLTGFNDSYEVKLGENIRGALVKLSINRAEVVARFLRLYREGNYNKFAIRLRIEVVTRAVQ
jgi:hypothetical protein